MNETDPQAVCNDGTSAVAYIRQGQNDGSSRFVFRIMGGGYETIKEEEKNKEEKERKRRKELIFNEGGVGMNRRARRE